MAGVMEDSFLGMSEKRIIEKSLCKLIDKYGIELYREESTLRFCALINDSFGCHYSRYRKLMILAIHERIPSRLLAKKNKSEVIFLKKILQDGFAREYDIKTNTAREIIEIFDEVLNSNIDKETVDNKIEFEPDLNSKPEPKKKEDHSMIFRYKQSVKPFAILMALLVFSLAVRNSITCENGNYHIHEESNISQSQSQTQTKSQTQSLPQVVDEKVSQVQLRDAVNKYNSGLYSDALPILKLAAKQQHAEACFYYGQCLRYGHGIKKDLDSAITYLDIAERGGFVQAANSLGIIFRQKGDPDSRKLACAYFKKGAEASRPDPYSMYNYASALATGLGCEKDVQGAVNFLQEGINYCYMNQLGYPQSVVKGLRDDMVLKLIAITDENWNFANIETLAVFLTQKIHRSYDRCYICTRWLTENISYDTQKQVRSVKDCYIQRIAVCEGYSRALKAMMDTLNISAQYVEGNWTNDSGHSWNVVYINSRPVYIDVTWAAGYVSSDNAFVKAYNAKWFDTPSSEFALNHIPG